MIPVNSIEIPERFVALASEWYSGSGSMLYAVCSTGGLRTGTNCPVSDYTDEDDRKRKWYVALWRNLSSEVLESHRIACREVYEYRKLIASGSKLDCESICDYERMVSDSNGLAEFLQFCHITTADLEADYNLEDWENE